jgi:hypothetical protein
VYADGVTSIERNLKGFDQVFAYTTDVFHGFLEVLLNTYMSRALLPSSDSWGSEGAPPHAISKENRVIVSSRLQSIGVLPEFPSQPKDVTKYMASYSGTEPNIPLIIAYHSDTLYYVQVKTG